MPSFTSLPREIRDEIYTHYFTTLPSLSRTPHPSQTPLSKPPDTWQPYGDDGAQFFKRPLSPTDSTALFLTNKQLYTEASAALTRLFPSTAAPSYALQIDFRNSLQPRTTWLHLPFLHPDVDVLEVWLTGLPSAADAADAAAGPGEADFERVYSTLLDTLERFILRGPALDAAHGGMRLARRRRRVGADGVRHPEYFFVNTIRVRLPGAAGGGGSLLGGELKRKIDRATGELLGTYEPARVSFEVKEYEGEMARWLVVIQCSGRLEVWWDGEGEGRCVWEWEEWKEAFKAFYIFQRRP